MVDADKEMMATLMAFINDHLDEEGLKIEELADAVNLGRTVFYGKIKALVGMTPLGLPETYAHAAGRGTDSQDSYEFLGDCV